VKIKGGLYMKKLIEKVVSWFRPAVLKEKEEANRVSRSNESGVKMLHVLPSVPAPGSRLSHLEELKRERERANRREEFKAWKENLQAVYKIQKRLQTA
jgi:hypothetical protein